jgi:hypothetical protein
MPNRPISDRPACPKCADRTRLARVLPGKPGFIREFFECAKCKHLWELEARDPVAGASGWLSGELKPPK